MRSIHKLLDEADAVCHFNGAKFDIPVLNKEFLIHGLNPPAPFKQIDLYQTCKRRFKFASNRLDFVSKVLGIGAKVEHKGMELWAGCMAGDATSWKTMEAYNKQDVRLTEKLYERLLPWIQNHPNAAVYGGEKRCCPNCGSTKLQARGEQVTTTLVYTRLQCRSCGKWSRENRPKNFRRPELVA